MKHVVLFAVACVALLVGFAGFSKACVTVQDASDGKCLESGCDTICSTPPERPLGAQLIPGFTVLSSPDGYFISSVLRNSPAAIAGILPGDKLISVDGLHMPIADGAGDIWQHGDAHSVMVARRDTIITARLTPVLLEEAVLRASSSDVLTVAVRSTTGDFGYPYISGMRVAEDPSGHSLIVIGVMPNSPADQADVKVGDKIICLSLGESCGSASIMHSYFRARLGLTMERGGKRKTVALTMVGLSDLWAAEAVQKGRPLQIVTQFWR